MRPDVNSREMQSQRKMQIYCCKYKLEMQIQNWEVFLISCSCFIIHYSIWPISPMVAWPIYVILYLVANISIHGLPICQATLWYSPFIGVPQGGIEFVTRLTGQRDGSWSGCVEAVEVWMVIFIQDNIGWSIIILDIFLLVCFMLTNIILVHFCRFVLV